MPQFSSTRHVRHSAADMFDLVADVERYPEFVPLCRALKVRQRISEPEGVEILVADMTVAYKLVREQFTSRVTLDRPNLKILVEYLEGPFSRLQNRWTFHPKGERSCDVGCRQRQHGGERVAGLGAELDRLEDAELQRPQRGSESLDALRAGKPDPASCKQSLADLLATIDRISGA